MLFLLLKQRYKEYFSACARLRALTVSIATVSSNSSCSDALTLPIGSFIQEAGLPAIERLYKALHSSPFRTTPVTRLRYSIVFAACFHIKMIGY